MIVLYVLEHCPFCNNALRLLDENNLKYNKIIVENTEKEKRKYKLQNKMNTFPQIFMQIDKNNFIKIGGNDDLLQIIKNCNNIKDSGNSIESIYYFYKHLYK